MKHMHRRPKRCKDLAAKRRHEDQEEQARRANGNVGPQVSKPYKKGDLVKYTSKFLRSIGWYTNVPTDGRVVEDQEEGSDLVHVQWCDEPDEPVGCETVHTSNIMPANKQDNT